MNRYFDTGDTPTDHNLKRLDHFASTRFDGTGTKEHLDDWISGVISTIEMLPPALQSTFDKHHFMISGSHWQWNEAERAARWKSLVQALDEQVMSVIAKFKVNRDGTGLSVNMSGRPETRGERVEALCKRLQEVGIEGDAGRAILSEIKHEAALGIGADVAELERFAKRKRKPDNYAYWVARHIEHMRIIAGSMHHLA